jgi:hypothetical protein
VFDSRDFFGTNFNGIGWESLEKFPKIQGKIEKIGN